MAYEYDVTRQKNILNDAARSARNERKSAGTLVDGANQWWKGTAGETFIREYRGIDQDVEKFLRCVDSAVDNLNRLPALIQRAERERLAERERVAELERKAAEAEKCKP